LEDSWVGRAEINVHVEFAHFDNGQEEILLEKFIFYQQLVKTLEISVFEPIDELTFVFGLCFREILFISLTSQV